MRILESIMGKNLIMCSTAVLCSLSWVEPLSANEIAIEALTPAFQYLLKKPDCPISDYQTTPVWSDEFDGNTLDAGKWSHKDPGSMRGDAYNSIQSISVSNGTLKNKIEQVDLGNNNFEYYSGMIETQGHYETKYGYFETRLKLPSILGPQSAFWLGSPKYGGIGNPAFYGAEIDVIEYVKISENEVHFSIYWDGYGDYIKEHQKSEIYPKVSDGAWHTFGLIWESSGYKFCVDGKLMYETDKGVSRTEQYMLISAEIKDWGTGGNVENIHNEDFPDYLEVDYVRVYKKL